GEMVIVVYRQVGDEYGVVPVIIIIIFIRLLKQFFREFRIARERIDDDAGFPFILLFASMRKGVRQVFFYFPGNRIGRPRRCNDADIPCRHFNPPPVHHRSAALWMLSHPLLRADGGGTSVCMNRSHYGFSLHLRPWTPAPPPGPRLMRRTRSG